MKAQARTVVALIALCALWPFPAAAQHLVVNAEAVKGWLTGPQKAVVVDVRMPEEYRAGHIAGAINIPADRLQAEQAKLPKDRAKPVIFYCRGVG